MRFLSSLALLPCLILSVVSSPIASNADIAAPAASPVPGVGRLNKVSEQLTVLLKEIKASSDNDLRGAQQMVDHAATVIRTLNDAVVEIENGPDIDLWTATSYARIAIPLTSQVHDLAASLKAKEKAISNMGVDGAVFQILDAAYAEMSRLQKVYTKKVPEFIRPIIKPWLSDLTETLGEAKENFRTNGQNDYAPALPPPSSPYPPPPQLDQSGGYYTTTVVVYVPGPTPAAALPGPAWQTPDFSFAHTTAQRPAWESIYEASKGEDLKPVYSPVGIAVPTPTV